MGDEKKPEEAPASPAADGEEDAEKRKAEVRARMAAEAEASKKKKGFMTPARKSKLRMLLRKKAAEELKKEEERRREEKRRVVGERCGEEKPTDVPIEGLRDIVQEYYDHICATESSKYDLEMQLILNDFIISDLNAAVTDLRGKFVKPTLKKVSKFEDKFAALNKKASEFKLKADLAKGD